MELRMEQRNYIDHYFNERWKLMAKLVMAGQLGDASFNSYLPRFHKITIKRWGKNIPEIAPMPCILHEWMKIHPYPNISRDEFIVTLAKRVETLEAVLAEKGGAL